MGMKFMVVKFPEEDVYSVVSESWIHVIDGATFCRYPSEDDFPDKRTTFKSLVTGHADGSTWKSYPCKTYEKFDLHKDAEAELTKILNALSTTDDEESSARPALALMKLRKSTKRPNRYDNGAEVDSDSESVRNGRNKAVTQPPLPPIPSPPSPPLQKSPASSSHSASNIIAGRDKSSRLSRSDVTTLSSKTTDRSQTKSRKPSGSQVIDRSRSMTRDHQSRSRTRDQRSRSRTRDQRSRSMTRDQRSRSMTRDQRSRSKTKDQRSRSKTKDQRSRSKTKDQRSRSKTRDQRSRSSTRDRRHSRSSTRDRRHSRSSTRDRRHSRSSTRDRRRSRSNTRDRRRSRSNLRGCRRSLSYMRDRRSPSNTRDRSRSRSNSKEARNDARSNPDSPLSSSSLLFSQDRDSYSNDAFSGRNRRESNDTTSASTGNVQPTFDANANYLHNDAVFRKVVVQGLASIKAVVLKLSKRYPDKAPPDHELEEIKMRLPVSTPTALEHLNGDIDLDKSLFGKLVMYLSLGGGEDIGSALRSAFRKIMPDEVQQLYSWEGLKKKKRFDVNKAIIRAINESVRKLFPSASDSTIKQYITVDLRNARQRCETRQKKEREAFEDLQDADN